MDKLDKYSILSLLVLTGSLVCLGLKFPEAKVKKIRHAAGSGNPGINLTAADPGIKTLKKLIASGSLKKADVLLGELLEKYPYEGEPHMLRGDIMMRKQDPIKAIFAYREAVDLNPDYVDKKTPLFQGRKIKIAVKEAKDSIDKSLSKNPGDSAMKKARKTLYYLLRKLAGSCG